jgi:hypothetical protein
LMLDRPLPQRAEFAAAHRLFFVGQLHGDDAVAFLLPDNAGGFDQRHPLVDFGIDQLAQRLG